MASIIRNGITITLTDAEVLAIRKEEHRQDVMFDVEQEVLVQEEDGWISFSSWEESGQEYASSDDARADFIEYVTDSIIETEEMYDQDPTGYRCNLRETVGDYAGEMGYIVEED